MFPFIYREKLPSHDLRHYVKCYWRFRRKFGPGKSQKIFPDNNYELIWVQEGSLSVDGVVMPRLFVGGQNRDPIILTGEGIVELWSVRFMPWGFAPFGNVGIAAASRALNEIFDEVTCQELNKLFAGATKKTIFAQLDDYLLQRLLASRFDGSTLQKVSERLIAKKGNLKIKDLAEYCNLSHRQLERTIRRATGKTPQEVKSRIRFEYARNAMVLQPELSFAALAHQYGYSDESHLIKDFRRYTEMTPKQYSATFRAMYAHIRPSDVPSIQFPEWP